MNISKIIVVRGGGDIATGIIQKLHRGGFNVLVLEVEKPTAIRRTVSLCEAIFDLEATVEDMTARLVHNIYEIQECWDSGMIPIMVDKFGDIIYQVKPFAVVDAIIAKRNLGTSLDMAEVVIGVGPGFTVGEDVDVVVESMRGHNLGRLIFTGSAIPNTGVPGEIGGIAEERVVHSPLAGVMDNIKKIGDLVSEGEILFYVDDIPALAPFTGLLRGLLREGLKVGEGMKVADIDPRLDVDYMTISDKARCIGGAVLEAVLYFKYKK